jgi:hypothetical protein
MRKNFGHWFQTQKQNYCNSFSSHGNVLLYKYKNKSFKILNTIENKNKSLRDLKVFNK